MTQSNSVYSLYKPFRNLLSNLFIDDCLYVIWAYSQFLQFKKPIPNDFEVHPNFLYGKFPEKGIYDWELEILLREVIINSRNSYSEKYSLKKWNNFSKVINKIKELEDEISGIYVNQSNILVELFRVANREFPWQTRPSKITVTRYYKIFNVPEINKIIYASTGLILKDIYHIGLAFLGTYLSHPAIKYPVSFDQDLFDSARVNNFLALFSIDILKMQEKLRGEEQINDKFAYSYSSLRAFPLIKMNYQSGSSIVCPMPTLLIWRITAGLYYEICDKNDFGNYFGRSFQNYVGETIAKSNKNENIRSLAEEEYHIGTARKDTVDWIVFDHASESALFIECKTKRIRMPAKIELTDQFVMDQELGKMSEFIIQLYKSIKDYMSNQFPSFPFDKEIKIYPVILTLEDWQMFNGLLFNRLTEFVKQDLKNNNIPLSFLDEMPYTICSVEEFEILIQVVQRIGIKKMFEEKVSNPEYKLWAVREYIKNQFPEEVKAAKFLFDSDFHLIFSGIKVGKNDQQEEIKIEN